jgi:hypothetical protein
VRWTAHFKIGRYEFREPDYRQILIWAKALGNDPLVLVNTLERICFTYEESKKVAFAVEQGGIISLAWDVVALPIKNFEWVAGLTIQTLAVFGKEAELSDILRSRLGLNDISVLSQSRYGRSLSRNRAVIWRMPV